ncbi:ArsR/SmtB family transcription factor [Planctomycetota bacterium]
MINKSKHLLHQKQADFLKALSHPFRIAIVDFLKDGEQCVCDIADHIQAERSNVSRHLAVMVNAGIISFRKDGLKVLYTLETPCVLEFLGCINQVIKQQLKQSQQLLRAV